VLSLIVPLPGVGVVPLIAMILEIQPQPGIRPSEHLLLFLGALFAGVAILIPLFDGRSGAPATRTPRPRSIRTILREA
jgi:hypothetical protein